MVLGLPVDITSPIRGQASAQMYAQAVQQQVQELKAENFQKLHLLRLPASVMQVLPPESPRITRVVIYFANLLGSSAPLPPMRSPSVSVCLAPRADVCNLIHGGELQYSPV